MDVVLRQADVTDFHFLQKMLYHAIFIPPGVQPPPFEIIEEPELRKYVADFGQHASDVGLIAQVTEAQIGAVWIRLIQGFGYVDAHIPELSIALLPDYRGQGIGTQLLTALFEIIDPSYVTVSLSVDVINPAHRLYLRFGFEIIDETDGTYTMLRSTTTNPKTQP
ncbi:MAG: GNAT family N-acetyltransferase [Chloroflexota bacterium]